MKLQVDAVNGVATPVAEAQLGCAQHARRMAHLLIRSPALACCCFAHPMLARDDPLTKMIIILTLLVMRAVLARSVGASVALAIGASVVPAHAAQPVVVAVDGTLCDLTNTLAASAFSVTCLIPPGGNPHAYRLKPSDRALIAKSDLIFHCLLYTSPSPRDMRRSRMPSSA